MVLGSVFLIAAFAFARDLRGGQSWVFILAFAFLLLGLWCLRPKSLTSERLMASLAGAMLLLLFAAHKAAGPGKSVDELARFAPKDAQWISYGVYHQGLPFYGAARCVIVAGTGELAFGRDHLNDAERSRWFIEDPKALNEVASRMKHEDPRPLFALAKIGSWKALPEDQKRAWEIVSSSPSTHLLRYR
jgi:hypothetical protein